MSSDIPSTMRAWQLKSKPSSIDKGLALNSSAPLPASATKLPPDSSLIKIHAASLNPYDHKLPETVPSFMMKYPLTPGHDVAGRIVSTNMSGIKEGQDVLAMLDGFPQGGCADYVVVTGSDNLAPIPAGLSISDASAIGTAALTAYQSIIWALDELSGTSNGQGAKGKKIFINGGSGGVGTYALQIAKALGVAHITTTCSTANVKFCESLGADQVIDYRSADPGETLAKEVGGDFEGKGYDLCVDNVGTPDSLYKAADKFLKPKAKFVQVGAGMNFGAIMSMGGRMARPAILGGGKRKFQFLAVKRLRKDFEAIAQMMVDGQVKAVVDETFEFEKVPEAFAKLKTGRTKGKIIINVNTT